MLPRSSQLSSSRITVSSRCKASNSRCQASRCKLSSRAAATRRHRSKCSSRYSRLTTTAAKAQTTRSQALQAHPPAHQAGVETAARADPTILAIATVASIAAAEYQPAEAHTAAADSVPVQAAVAGIAPGNTKLRNGGVFILNNEGATFFMPNRVEFDCFLIEWDPFSCASLNP